MQFEIVPFHDDQIEAIRGQDGHGRISIKRICENLKVDSSGQLQKLKGYHWATVEMISTVDPNGRERITSVLPVDQLPMWLVTIQPSKIAEPLREKLRKYQLEARDVLARHFMPAAVAAPTLDPRLAQLELLGSLVHQQIEIERRLTAIEAKVDAEIVTQTGETAYVTVLGYCNERGIRLPSAQMGRAGKAASEICRIEGHEIGRCASEKWGHVNSYPVEVLDRVFASYGKAA